MRTFRLKNYHHAALTAEQLAEYHAEREQGVLLLQELSAARPLSPDAAQEQEYLRFLTFVASQYRAQGLGWLELLRAGHNSLADYFEHNAGMADETTNFIAWAVREGIIRAVGEKEN